MELFKSHQRLPATVFTAALLVVAGLVYSRLTSPFLDVQPLRKAAARSGTTPSTPTRSPDFQTLADEWFPEDQWVRSAGKRFRDKQRYMFFNNFELENQNRSMVVEPIAVLWASDKAGEPPVTITAASAQLDRSSAFQLEEGEFGRIVSGSLFGDVRIRGPDGLRIHGSNFHVSEQDMKMWSNQRVRFAWENHTGYAENGVEIKLLGSTDSESGLVSVSDIQSVTLMGRVVCDVRLPQGKGEPDIPIRINAANGFEYFVPTRTARFSGFPDRKLNLKNQIVVQRTTESGSLDRLFCSQLTLYFQPRIDESGTDDRRMDIQRIDAEGARVVFYSPENELTAWMTNVRFNVSQRTLQMWNRGTGASAAAAAVRVLQRGSELLVPRISVFQNEEGQIHAIECTGAGSLTHSDQNPRQSITARWLESFVYRNGTSPRVILTGKASATQPSSGMSLAAGKIDIALQRAADSESDKLKSNSEEDDPIDLSNLRPQSLTAFDDIHLNASQLAGTLRKQLTVTFTNETNELTTDGSFRQVSQTNGGGPDESGPNNPFGQSSTATPGESNDFTEFAADSLEAVMLIEQSGDTQQTRLTDVWLKGGVTVEHTSSDADQSFRAEGNVAYAAAGFDGQREIQLFGDPATVVSTERRIEGQRIDLHEPKREVRVESSGRLRLVVDRGLDGRPLPRPSPLDIYWGRQMVFSGRTARFVGDIRAVMKDDLAHHLEIRCEGMTVQFTGDVLLQDDGDSHQLSTAGTDGKGQSEIESITCDSLVTVHADQFVAGILEATHRARFSDFRVNLLTGDFHASGPGWIESTQPDRENQLRVAPEVTARANRPVRTRDNNFVYVKASFIGTLSGNLEDQVTRLANHVTGVFGPVRRLGDRLTLDAVDTSQLPDQAGILRCEEMTVSVIPGLSADQHSFSLTANKNSRLESRRFSGDADRITYDHSKQQFILKSEGDTLATVYHRPGDSNEVNNLVGKRFEYYPGRNQLTANQITGVQAAQ
jgi:hypothetical protein